MFSTRNKLHLGGGPLFGGAYDILFCFLSRGGIEFVRLDSLAGTSQEDPGCSEVRRSVGE